MKSQRGGFFLGVIVGMLIGLAIALGVALYITKVPLPFIDKVPQRTAEQDAAEAEKNKNWDPNGPLYGKNPAKPRPVQVEPAASAASAGGEAPAVEVPVAPPPVTAPAASAAPAAPGAAPCTACAWGLMRQKTRPTRSASGCKAPASTPPSCASRSDRFFRKDCPDEPPRIFDASRFGPGPGPGWRPARCLGPGWADRGAELHAPGPGRARVGPGGQGRGRRGLLA